MSDPQEPARTASHLQPFQPGALPVEAFDYQRYMTLYGLSKRDAKQIVQRFKDERVYVNDLYQVNVQPAINSPFIHLSIKRRDRAPIHDWRDLQAIKNMIVGPEFEAIEVYPAESRLVDTANQYHLWVLANGHRFPVGFVGRSVIDHNEGPDDNSVQRPLPQTYQQAVEAMAQAESDHLAEDAQPEDNYPGADADDATEPAAKTEGSPE